MSREYINRELLENAFEDENKNGNFVFSANWIMEIVDNLPTADVVPKSEVAKEIFEEIEEIFNKRIAFYTDMAKQSKFTEKHYAETMIKNCEIYLQEIAELKKKYTEGNDDNEQRAD